ncbi:hemin uptake protein HemP [Polynucleobacter sp. TUM22923]|uniref:hemin uptake protein HemP n=1 Tax=Polynucleobacter sp. TUM22923 TaxID=3022126 RepID=UPI00336536A5
MRLWKQSKSGDFLPQGRRDQAPPSVIASRSTLPWRPKLSHHTPALKETSNVPQDVWGRVIQSTSLMGNDRSIIILHEGHRYQLSITKLRKLILTK